MKTAVILAGGLGTRLREVVSDVPKPMAPIHGRPFLAHQLDYWIAKGIGRFVLSVGYKHELIMDFFGSTYRGARIDYVIEQTPMGTGGGLLLALDTIGYDEPFLLLNGDTYFDIDLDHLVQFATERQADWVFSLFHTNDPGRYMGIDLDPTGQLTSFQSEKKSTLGRLASGGVYWINPRALSALLPTHRNGKLSLEDDLLPALKAAGGRLFGLAYSGTFIDIGLPEDYHRSASIFSGITMNPIQRLKKNVDASMAAARQLMDSTAHLEQFDQAVRAVVNRYQHGGRLYIAGNGGSAADAQHLAAEFVSKLAADRAPLPAEALTVDSSILTAIGNDYGYDAVFSRQITGKATPKDIFLGITTSGRSPNILKALDACRAIGIPSIIFCGRDGGMAKSMADYCIVAPGEMTSTIQELHIILAHTLCECVELAIFGDLVK